MELSDKAIKEFQKIYQQSSGEKITPSQAKQLGLNLIQLVYLTYHQIPKNDYGKIKKPY